MTSNAPTNFVRAYLRASTAEQDASRALETIEAFARERGLIICSYYIENESGSRLDRPELFRLLRDCQQNDILLIEDVDRLSRLSGEDWNTLKKMIRQKDIRVRGLTLSGTKTHVKQRFLPLTPLLMVSDVLWSPVLPA
ncbi:TPA: recombinase family protein [Escherichia coli]